MAEEVDRLQKEHKQQEKEEKQSPPKKREKKVEIKNAEEDLETEEDIKRRNDILSRRTLKRIYPGSQLKDCYNWKPITISQKESAALDASITEYIQELIHDDYTNIEKIIEIPRDLVMLVQSNNNVDGKLLYQYYTMKNFLIECGLFVTFLSKQCNNKQCSKMQATTQYRYRCSAHRRPRDCSSIQYCIHTLDLFTEKLNNKEYVNAADNRLPEKKCKKDMGDLCRRVYRIFAHAFFHHKTLFDEYESDKCLCTRFIMFFRRYGLVPSALFKREIQIPNASLYYNRNHRADKIRTFKIKQRQNEMKQQDELSKARRHVSMTTNDANLQFMKNMNFAELESDEIY